MLNHSARTLIHQTNGSTWSQFSLVWKFTGQHNLQSCQWHKKSCICLSSGQESYLHWNRILGYSQGIGFNSQAFPDTLMFALLHSMPAECTSGGVSTDATRGQVVEKEGNLLSITFYTLPELQWRCSASSMDDETKGNLKCFKVNTIVTMDHIFWPQTALKYLVPWGIRPQLKFSDDVCAK